MTLVHDLRGSKNPTVIYWSAEEGLYWELIAYDPVEHPEWRNRAVVTCDRTVGEWHTPEGPQPCLFADGYAELPAPVDLAEAFADPEATILTARTLEVL